MKLVVIYRPRSTPPVEAMPMMLEGMGQWVKANEGKFESLYFFAGGGGFGVGDFKDANEVQKLTAEHPFTPFSDVEIRPVLDAQSAMDNLRDAMAQRG